MKSSHRSKLRLIFSTILPWLIWTDDLRAMVIQAEDYDTGGNGVGYYDTTSGNSRGHYRTDDVDIRSNGEGGHYILGIKTGEWLAYTITVPETGNYHLNIRVASIYLNRYIHFTVDGVDVTGQMKFGETASNTSFITLSKLIPLTAGTHVFKAVMDRDSFTFDSFELVLEPNAGPVVNAGSDAVVTYPGTTLALSGTVTDDGLPNPPAQTTVKWTQVAGKRHVTFEDPTSLTTNIKLTGHDEAYVLRLTASDGMYESYDDVTITATGMDSMRVTLPAVIQAEDYRGGGPNFGYVDTTLGNSGGQHRTDDVDILTCSEGGYRISGIAAEEWVAFDVLVPTSGYYTLSARVAAASAGHSLHFEAGDVDVTGPIEFGNTGGDDVYVDASAGAFLEKGRHTLKVCMDTAGFSLNSIKVELQTPITNIVSDGAGNAEIVTKTSPPRGVVLAARELQTYIQKISGATLPIVTAPTSAPVKIYVGQSSFTDALSITNAGLKNGAYHIASGSNYLVLLGDEADYVPIEPYATSTTNRPIALALWDVVSNNYWGNPYDSVYGDKCASLNIWSLDGRGTINAVYHFLRNLGVRWYFPGAVGEVCPTASTIGLPAVNVTVTPKFALRQFSQPGKTFKTADVEEPLWQLRLGINNRSDRSAFPWAHGMKYLLEREELKNIRPEHYAIYNGVPATTACMGVGAPRLSSPGLFSDNLDFIRLLFDHYQEPNVGVMPPDGFTKISEGEPDISFAAPERGEDGRMSDYVFDYVNRIAAELLVSHPEKMITAGAYSRYRLPPANIEAMSPNVAVVLVRGAAMLGDHDAASGLQMLADDWLDCLPSQQLYLWDKFRHANPDAENNYKGIPAYFPTALSDDVQFMKNRAKGFFTEVYREPDESDWHPLASNHLNAYVASRLYWNPSLDVDALLEEYYAAFYGPASAEMKDFVEYCELNWAKAPADSGIMAEMKIRIDAAYGAAGIGSIFEQRVQLIKDFIYLQNP